MTPYKNLVAFAGTIDQLRAFSVGLNRLRYRADPEPFFGFLVPPANTELYYPPRNYVLTYRDGVYMFMEDAGVYPELRQHFTGEQLEEALEVAGEEEVE